MKSKFLICLLLLSAVFFASCIKEESQIEKAQREVSFEIVVPEYVPEGYEFIGVRKTRSTKDERMGEGVMLFYDKDGRRFVISEWQIDSSFEHKPYPGEVEVAINDKKGWFSTPGPYNLMWFCGDKLISFSADFTGGRESVKSEMIKIAESIECEI